MLDISKLLGEGEATAAGRGARFGAIACPVVVWNVTRRCNLHCEHCYASARGTAAADELDRDEGRRLVDGLARWGVPAVVLSGGEPLLRADTLELARRARDGGVHVALSSNGTLIDAAMARRLREAGVGYVGVSIDGLGSTHDRVRGARGAFDRALAGLRHARDAGLAVGLRFTLSRSTLAALPGVLDLMEAEGVARGYVSHLVQVGRAHRLAPYALRPAETRAAVEAILDRAESLRRRGVPLVLVTGNGDADGVLLYLRLRRTRPVAAERVRLLLRRRGGNSAGRTIANVDARGDVHPDQFWPHHTVGSVRARPLAEIWTDAAQPLLARLRDRRPHVHGRCARCPHWDLCAGGSRVRAEALTGDLWASDPGCHLTDDELGLPPSEEGHRHARALVDDPGGPDGSRLEWTGGARG